MEEECRRSTHGSSRTGGRSLRSHMFSPSLELILTIAYREATRARHTHLTLEHLLYALAHDPDGRAHPRRGAAWTCGGCGRSSTATSRESVEQWGRGRAARARADARLPARPADRRAPRAERRPRRGAGRRRARGDAPGAEVLRRAAARGAGRHPARHPRTTSRTASRRCPSIATTDECRRRAAAARRRRGGPAAPRATRSAPTRMNLTERAARRRARSAHRPPKELQRTHRDPLPPPQEQPGLRRRAPASARRRWPKAWPLRLLAGRRARSR